MRTIAIYGAGGFGREIALMIQQINVSSADPWQVLGFFDDGKPKGSMVDGLPVLGNVDELNSTKEPLALALAVADPLIRNRLHSKITKQNITYPALIHPGAIVGDLQRNRFEEGVIITAGNVFTTGIHIEAFAIINLLCTIGHDVNIGAFSTVMPGCSISGSVNIGSQVMIGSGARILPGITIGDQSKVGAGAVLVEDVPAGVTVVGVPGRVMKR